MTLNDSGEASGQPAAPQKKSRKMVELSADSMVAGCSQMTHKCQTLAHFCLSLIQLSHLAESSAARITDIRITLLQ